MPPTVMSAGFLIPVFTSIVKIVLLPLLVTNEVATAHRRHLHCRIPASLRPANDSRPQRNEMMLVAATGLLKPLRRRLPTGSASMRWSTAALTAGETRICPLAAASQRREARLATEPCAV